MSRPFTRGALAILLVAGASAACGAHRPSSEPKAARSGPRTLVWSDEFAGPSGARVDATRWVTEVGGHGWGNRELQYYTDSGRNAATDGAGNLVIRTLRERHEADGAAWEYTSARLKTQGLFAQAYGRFEARIQIPRGQGIWPAFWLLGSDIKAVGWPRCGEIDVMENIGREPTLVPGSLHGPGFSGGRALGAAYTLPVGAAFADAFHVFAVEWEPERVRFFVDDTVYHTRSRADLKPGQTWVFDHPFFMLVNVAVGGNWPGSPDETTVFPQAMRVDYVRVYR